MIMVEYIKHSCFLVETSDTVFLFDYTDGKLPKIDPSKKIYIFASHSHYDHFTKDIFTLFDESTYSVTYILSDDIKSEIIQNKDNIIFVSAHNTYNIDNLTIKTYKSTDLGVAFLVKSNISIYHAGDLHNWYWPGQNPALNEFMDYTYTKEIQKLQNEKIDIAFVVLDPRLEEYYDKGMLELLEVVQPNTLFPMHLWGDYSITEKFIKSKALEDYSVDFKKIEKENQIFLIKNNN